MDPSEAKQRATTVAAQQWWNTYDQERVRVYKQLTRDMSTRSVSAIDKRYEALSSSSAFIHSPWTDVDKRPLQPNAMELATTFIWQGGRVILSATKPALEFGYADARSHSSSSHVMLGPEAYAQIHNAMRQQREQKRFEASREIFQRWCGPHGLQSRHLSQGAVINVYAIAALNIVAKAFDPLQYVLIRYHCPSRQFFIAHGIRTGPSDPKDKLWMHLVTPLATWLQHVQHETFTDWAADVTASAAAASHAASATKHRVTVTVDNHQLNFGDVMALVWLQQLAGRTRDWEKTRLASSKQFAPAQLVGYRKMVCVALLEYLSSSSLSLTTEPESEPDNTDDDLSLMLLPSHPKGWKGVPMLSRNSPATDVDRHPLPCAVCNGMDAALSTRPMAACELCATSYHRECEQTLMAWSRMNPANMRAWHCRRCVQAFRESERIWDQHGQEYSKLGQTREAVIMAKYKTVDEIRDVETMHATLNSVSNHTGGPSGDSAYGELATAPLTRLYRFLADVHHFEDWHPQTHGPLDFPLDEKAVFLDIGSGLGRPNLHVLLQTHVSQSVGIEFEPGRWRPSIAALHELMQQHSDLVEREAQRHRDGAFPVAFVAGDVRRVFSLEPFTHVICFDRGIPPSTLIHLAAACNASKTVRYYVSFQKPKDLIREFGFALRFLAQMPAELRGGKREKHKAYIYYKVMSDSLDSQNDYVQQATQRDRPIYPRQSLPEFLAPQLKHIPYLDNADKVYKQWIQKRYNELFSRSTTDAPRTRNRRGSKSAVDSTMTTATMSEDSV